MTHHPKVATRSCDHCLQYAYDEETGKPEENINGDLIERHIGCPPPCKTEFGCEKGTPEKPLTLNRSNSLALLRFREWRAVGSFPDDAIVLWAAGIIDQFYRDHEQMTRSKEIHDLLMVVMAGRGL